MITAADELAVDVATTSTETLEKLLEEVPTLNGFDCYYYAKAELEGRYTNGQQVDELYAIRQRICNSREIFTPLENLLWHHRDEAHELITDAIKFELSCRGVAV